MSVHAACSADISRANSGLSGSPSAGTVAATMERQRQDGRGRNGWQRLAAWLQRAARCVLGPPARQRRAIGPEEFFLVIPGPVTTLVPLHAPTGSARAEEARATAFPHSDFASRAERDRLLALPPLDAAAATGVDWDELARDLDRGA